MEVHYYSNFEKINSIDCLIIFTAENFNFDKFRKELPLSKDDFLALQKFIDKKEFTGEEGQNEFFSLPLSKKINTVYLIGLGKNRLSTNNFRDLWGKRFQRFKNEKVSQITIYGLNTQQNLAAVEVSLLTTYDFLNYKTTKKSPTLNEIVLCSSDIDKNELSRVQIECQATNWARDLINTPAQDMTPDDLANIAEKMAKDFKLEYDIFDEDKIKGLGMGALHAVSFGSEYQPRLIILKYRVSKLKKHIALVGKGVTFDSGGLSLKPSQFMIAMKSDMAGAATALGAFRALVQLKPNINISCIVPTTENMLDGKSMKLGDVVKAYNGKTIEIHNSDAEGRLILADALSYVDDKLKADVIVDIATLTGAVKVCLGHQHGGILGNNQKIIKQLMTSGNDVNELLWQLPLTDYHQQLMKSEIADLCNIASKPIAGTSTAAAFLANFIGNTPWAHLDIAGVARDSNLSYLSHHGATGFGVRLLSQWVQQCAK